MIPLGVGDIIMLAEKGQSLYTHLRSKRTRDIAAGAGQARTLPELYDSLRTIYYNVPVLAGPDGPFPMGFLAVYVFGSPVSGHADSRCGRFGVPRRCGCQCVGA